MFQLLCEVVLSMLNWVSSNVSLLLVCIRVIRLPQLRRWTHGARYIFCQFHLAVWRQNFIFLIGCQRLPPQMKQISLFPEVLSYESNTVSTCLPGIHKWHLLCGIYLCEKRPSHKIATVSQKCNKGFKSIWLTVISRIKEIFKTTRCLLNDKHMNNTYDLPKCRWLGIQETLLYHWQVHCHTQKVTEPLASTKS